MSTGKRALTGFVSLVALAACTVQLDGGATSQEPQGPDGKEVLDGPSSGTRFRRLTHAEWQNTLVDLFGEKNVEGVGTMRADPRSSGFLFDNAAESLEVDGPLWLAYQREALRIAENVAGDTALIERWAGTAGSESERATAFIDTLGTLTFRRPITDEERQRYLGLFERGKTAYDDSTGFEGGVRLVVEALLQSANFLYRVESSAGVKGGVVPLTSRERAQRLSYFLWGTMPDAELTRAADEGKLDDTAGVAAEVERMLGDPRAIDVIWDFHRQLLDVARYDSIKPSASAFPNLGADLDVSAKRETELFVRNVAEEGGGVAELLSSTTSFVDKTLADVYGLEGSFGEEFQRVTLPADQRRGVLTQVGFLASHATSVDPDPIHRGVFIAKRLACIKIAAPPDAATPLPPAGDKSNRQLVEDHTETQGCASCHATIINPLGFPFEMFDAVGAYRETDRGHEVDPSSSPRIDRRVVEVGDAVELAEALADSADVAACYASHWVAFAHGRPVKAGDSRLVGDVAALLQTRSLGMLDVVAEVAVSKAFLNRSSEVE